jgi:hypothetical protein
MVLFALGWHKTSRLGADTSATAAPPRPGSSSASIRAMKAGTRVNVSGNLSARTSHGMAEQTGPPAGIARKEGEPAPKTSTSPGPSRLSVTASGWLASPGGQSPHYGRMPGPVRGELVGGEQPSATKMAAASANAGTAAPG